jgi:NTE family protein
MPRPQLRATSSERHGAARRPAIGLVLSGGGARGFAHIGLLRVLERHGIEPDVLAGTSMGAILGALYAHGYRADDLHELATSISWRDVVDVSLVGGLIKGDRLHALLAGLLPARFEELGKPLAVTCTDLEAGEELVFTEGDLVTAVRASACFPGAFEPVEHEGRALADGGILNNLPVDALALMRADLTLASDVSPPRRAAYLPEDGDRDSWWQRMVATVTLERRAPLAAVTLRSADIMMRLLTDAQYVHHPADLRVQHEMPTMRMESFWALDEIVAQGEVNAEAALRARPELLARLQAASGPPAPRRPQAAGTPTATGPSATGPSATGPSATGPSATGPSATAPSATAPSPDGATGADAPPLGGASVALAAAGEPGHVSVTAVAGDGPDADAHPLRTLWSHLRRG